MNNNLTDEFRQKGSWTKFKEWFGISEVDEEFDEDDIQPELKRTPVTLRLQQTRLSHVAIRLPKSFDDARLAADGLKEGRQQIINLEKATPEMSERIIDFLNGVTYALNGFVEKVGDRIYVFAPSNVVIDVSSDFNRSSLGLFERNL